MSSSRSRRPWNHQHPPYDATNFWYLFLSGISRIAFFSSWTRSSYSNSGFASPRSCPTLCLSSKISSVRPHFPRPNNQFFYQVAANALCRSFFTGEVQKLQDVFGSLSMTTAVASPSHPRKGTELQSRLSLDVDSKVVNECCLMSSSQGSRRDRGSDGNRIG